MNSHHSRTAEVVNTEQRVLKLRQGQPFKLIGECGIRYNVHPQCTHTTAPHTGKNTQARTLPLATSTLEALRVPGKVVHVALVTRPITRLGFGVRVCEALPPLLHEEA